MPNSNVIDLDMPVLPPTRVITPQRETVPVGYIPISLSMGGKFGVPKTLHCRNFSTAELIDISLFDNNYLTKRIISILNSAIHEQTDVSLWPDKAIIELLVNLYANFFSAQIDEVLFPWNEEDIKFLESKGNTEAIKNLQDGTWKPRIDIPLSSIKTKEIKDDIKSHIVFSKKDKEGKTYFKAKFLSYPRFGDALLLDTLVEQKFIKEEEGVAPLRKRLELRDRLRDQGKDDTTIEVSEKEYFSLQLLEVTKIKYLTQASMAIYLVEYNGKDVIGLSIDERIEIISNPLFDVTLGTQLTKKYNATDFGIDPEIEVMNPITQEPCKRRFTFQVLALLQTLQTSDANGYDISYDD